MIRFRNLTKSYGTGRGVFDLSFEITDGEVFGLLGPENSGKTTIFSLLLGFSTPGNGWCSVDGRNCHDHAKDLPCQIGYLPEQPEFPTAMTGLQYLRFQTAVRERKSIEKGIRTAQRLGLNLEEKIARLSPMDKKKLGIAGALVHDPRVVLLDEPTRDLDQAARHCLAELIREEKEKGKSVVWASREFEKMDRCCDRIGMLRRGNLVNIDEVAALRRQKRQSYILTFSSEQEAVGFLKENVEVQGVCGSQVTVAVTGELTPFLPVLEKYHLMGWEKVHQPIEVLFIHYYGGEIRG